MRDAIYRSEVGIREMLDAARDVDFPVARMLFEASGGEAFPLILSLANVDAAAIC